MKKRRFVSLLNALLFSVLAVTGIVAFVRPFSIQIIGLHSLTGFVFLVFIAFHVSNNFGPLKKYFRSKVAWVALGIVVTLSFLFFLQPGPVKAILGLSGNLGPALDRFELDERGMLYRYSPDPSYKMVLEVRTGTAYDSKTPPYFAIWLENQSFYHIKTLYEPEAGDRETMLPYWAFKVRGWKEAKEEAERKGEDLGDVVDAISGATENSSFDPADYILPRENESSMPYRLMIEINQPGDENEKMEDQPSLIYQVEIDNFDPRTFQLLDLVGFPKLEKGEDGEDAWAIYYVDEGITSAMELIDSALLTIDRTAPDQ